MGFLAILIGGILDYARRADRIAVKLLVVPADSEVTIAGEKYSNGTIWLKPGTYPFSASKNGFTSSNMTITITEDTTSFAVGLIAESDEAKTWANDNSALYKEVEDLSNANSDQSIEIYENMYPELSMLPYRENDFFISRVINDDGSVVVYINYYRRTLNDAIRKLYDLGIDPTKYTVEFDGYTNPFEEYKHAN
jgi:hypothetical protein